MMITTSQFIRNSNVRTGRWRQSAYYLFLLLVMPMLFSGCATPNLKPFADGAASFSASIKQTNAAVETKLSSEADIDSSVKGILKKYQEAANIYNGMAGLAAGYSSAVSELGTAGETGGQAAEQLLQTVKGFTDFTGISGVGLPASLAGTVAGRAIQQAALAWTRLQAQKDLLATMKAANPAVQKLSQALVEVYGRPTENGDKWRPFESIIRELVLGEQDQLKKSVGKGKLAFYKAATVFLSGKYADAGDYLASGDAKSRASMATSIFDQNTEKLIKQMETIRGDITAYQAANQALLDWQAKQIKASYLIADTAKAWAAEHQRLLHWLETCGGTRFMKNSCGQFSAASLNALASEIQFIIKGDQ